MAAVENGGIVELERGLGHFSLKGSSSDIEKDSRQAFVSETYGSGPNSPTEEEEHPEQQIHSHSNPSALAGKCVARHAVNVAPMQSKGLTSDGHPSEGTYQEDDLKKVVQQQVEYYFSKENLSSDKYLMSQMDGDNFVPVAVLASFNQVKKLTSNMDLILDAIRSSPQLQLDERDQKVRAVPEKRCILILRDVADGATEESIRQLLTNEKCPKLLSCEFVENNCWYIGFSSEEDAQKAYQFVREDVKEFMGVPIGARIKGTTVQRPSGVPKKPAYVQYPVPPAFPPHIAPVVAPFYPVPGPWSHAFMDPNFVHFATNGYPPPPPVFQGPGRFGGGRGRTPGGRVQSRFTPAATEGNTSANGGRGMRVVREDDYYSNRQRNIPARMRRQRVEEPNRPPRQLRQMQQENFDLETESGSFPPLSENPSNNYTPAPALQSVSISEEGASNLADIVKGKRQKEGSGSGLMNGSGMPPLPNGFSDRLSNKMAAQAKAAAVVQQHSSQSPRVQQKVEPKASQQDSKVAGDVSPTSLSPSCSDEKALPTTTSANSTTANPSKPAQVPRSDSPVTPAVKVHKHKERKTPPTSRVVSKHSSPKSARKYNTQFVAASTDKAQSQKNAVQEANGGGNGKLSYAQMAQKPKAPKPAGGESSPPHDSPVPPPLQTQPVAAVATSYHCVNTNRVVLLHLVLPIFFL
ncbi:hypothetical protein EMCRGX_G018683 [Ephydatia muelleri]